MCVCVCVCKHIAQQMLMRAVTTCSKSQPSGAMVPSGKGSKMRGAKVEGGDACVAPSVSANTVNIAVNSLQRQINNH